MYHIQIITEDAIISYDENIMRIEDKEYVNGDYVYIVYEDTEKKYMYPLKVKDEQFIKFLKKLIK